MAAGERKGKDGKVVMSRSEAIKEHERLTRVLSTGKGVAGELRKQKRELLQYRRSGR